MLSAQTKSDRDEWISVLSKYCGSMTNDSSPHKETQSQSHTDDSNFHENATLVTNSVTSMQCYDKTRVYDVDEMSTFSDDSIMTNNSSFSVVKKGIQPPDRHDALIQSSSFESLVINSFFILNTIS